MDTSESPLNDLDLYCDWSGDPNDLVEVRMTVEVWCTPSTAVPILNTCFPIVRVKASSICPTEAKPDATEALRHPSHGSWNEPPRTPENKTATTPLKNVSSPPGPNDLSSLTDTESVIVRNDTESSGSPSKTVLVDSYSIMMNEHTLNGTPTVTPNSRKRNAKAASLPDSVTDSERDYGGAKHKTRPPGSGSQSPMLSLKHSSKPSLIPRPVSSLNQQTEPAKVPLPTSSTPVSVADSSHFEDLLPIHQDSFDEDRLLENGDAEKSTFVVPEDMFNDGTDPADTKPQQDLEKLSTVVSPGTPCDLNSSPVAPSSSVGSPADEVIVLPRSSLPVTESTSRGHPRLVNANNRYSVYTPSTALPGSYSVSITFLLHMQKGRPRGWWNLVFPDLPRLRRNECGYIYFWIPAEQGIEIRTMHLKRYSLNQACMMGQFPLPLKLTIPLRLCDGHFYGFLRDFKVTQTVRAEVVEEDDLRNCRVKYFAVCSIDLIQRDFWAEKCGVSLFVHGGPEGDFTCNVQAPRGQFQAIHLSGPNTQPGISCLQVICPPLSLVSLAITWELELPRERVSTWTPRIKSSFDSDDIEDGLQREYAEAEKLNNFEIYKVDPLARLEDNSSSLSPPRSRLSRVWFSRKWRRIVSIFILLMISRLLYRVYKPQIFYDSAVGCVVVETVETAPVQDESCMVEVPPVEDACVEVPLVEDVCDDRGTANIDSTTETEVPAQEPDVTEVECLSKVESAVSFQPIVTPSLSIRDRIDYLLGWRGPLGEL